MANEIGHSEDSASVLYALVYRMSDKQIYIQTTGLFEAYNAANIGTYDIAMTASGDMHFANFPVIAAGTYYVQIRKQAGASPSVDDRPIGHGFMVWDGTAEVLPSDIATDLTAIEGKIDIIDGNVDDIETAAGTIDTNVDSLTTSVASVLTAQQQVHSNLGGEDLTNVKIVSNL